MVLIIAAAVSFIPLTAVYFWLKLRLRKNDEDYKKLCTEAIKKGALSILPVVLVSASFSITFRLLGLRDGNPLLYQGLHNFFVLAFSEELCKFLAFKKLIKNTDYPYSWLDVTAFMTIIGIGFGLLEAVIYAIDATVPVILVRGICLPHAGYGFLTGYFYGKGVKERNSITKWTGFALAWLMHGLYDFSLKEEFIAINDNLFIIPLLLAFLDIVLVIILIIFARKARKQEVYLEPLV